MGSCLLSPTGLFRHQPRGLIAHSLNVTRTLLRLRGLLAPWLSEESCVIVGLYHDVGKVGEEGKPYYIRTVGADGRRTGRWDYRVNRQVTHLDLATRSLVLVSRFVPLQQEEWDRMGPENVSMGIIVSTSLAQFDLNGEDGG